ncbi:MAG: hypothetical protein Q8Q62_21515 [Mesorhizobium sp.]|nr:hypothetical protein [Mesorhizobium sp.]
MADPFTMAPLSGEIMAGPPPSQGARRRDVAPLVSVDADYETLPRAVTSAAAEAPIVSAPTRAAETPPLGMDILRGAALPASGALSRHGGVGFWLAATMLVAGAFWFSGGHSMARHMLASATESGAPLRVVALVSRVEAIGGRDMLFVDGELTGSAGSTHDLMISVTASNGTVARYKLGTGPQPAEGGGTWRFSSRLEAPRSGVKSVSVTVVPEG